MVGGGPGGVAGGCDGGLKIRRYKTFRLRGLVYMRDGEIGAVGD